MKALPYTIRLFVPDGDPKGLKIIDKMNWTGKGYVFSRDLLSSLHGRDELSNAGVYILSGHSDSDDENALPIIYIGQTDDLKKRLIDHDKDPRKDFWQEACVFLSTNDGLNRAHITWIEHELIRLAHQHNQSTIYNGIKPQEPTLTEAEKADTKAFLHEMLQIMPLVGLNYFEEPKVFKPINKKQKALPNEPLEPDTIIVPAKDEGFSEVFIGEDAWYAIRISGGKLQNIRYIAAYQSQPISAITHYAPVEKIIPHGDTGKYKVIFAEPAKEIGPIPYADLPSGAMQGPRYTYYDKLIIAQRMGDLF